MKKLIIFTILIVVLLSVFFWWNYRGCVFEPQPVVSNFKECTDKGYLIMELYPRQCRTPDGKTFTEDIGNELEKRDIIRVSSPRPNEVVKSPLKITGEARGYWFFEADFPVKLVDENGDELGTAIATAKSEWMTEDFVPFEAVLNFDVLAADKGTLILEKDNPSGLLENADELRIPVDFNGASQLPNPASVYCKEQGGSLESRNFTGGTRGFCIFNDASECGQWEFFQGECEEGKRFCKDFCGDGTCQEGVCMAVGCPCAESKQTCLKDCK